MGKRQKILDDLAAFAGSSVGALSGSVQQLRNEIKIRIDEKIHQLDFVPRSEFKRLEDLLIKSRLEQESLEKRIEDLENALSKKDKTAKK